MNIFISLLVAGVFALIGSLEWALLGNLGVSTHRLGEGIWIMFYLPIFAGASAFSGLVGTLICFHISGKAKYSSGFLVILNSGKRFCVSSFAMFLGSFAGGLLWVYLCPQFLNIHSLPDEIIYAMLLAPATIVGSSIGILLAYLSISRTKKTTV